MSEPRSRGPSESRTADPGPSDQRDPLARERSDTAGERSTLVPALIALRVAVVGVLAATTAVGLDSERITELGHAEGTPYRDYDVEYPPILFGIARIVSGSDASSTGVRVAVLAFVLDLVVYGLISKAWGRRASANYLVLGSLLLPYIYLTLEHAAILCAVLSLALALRGRDRTAGAVAAVGVFTKLWPGVLLISFTAARKFRAAAWGVLVAVAAGAAWIWVAGAEAASQVLGFRGAQGWEIGSTPGVLHLLFTDEPVIFSEGASRIGSSPGWAKAALVVLGLAVMAMAVMAERAREEPALVTLVCVGAILLVSPLYSLQFASWLVPFAAISRRSRIIFTCGVLAGASTVGHALFQALDSPDLVFRSVLAVRIIATAFVTSAGLWELRRE